MSIQPAYRVSGTREYYFSIKLREIREMSETGLPVVNLGIGNPDLAPPQTALDRLRDALTETGVHGYQPYRGLPVLRQAFGEWYRRVYQVSLDPDSELIPLIGSKEGIFYISMAFLNPGDRVLVPDVGYPAYKSVTEMVGAEALMYEISERTGWVPDFSRLEKQDLTGVKLMWVNYPNMPSGKPGSTELFKQLVAFGKKRNILICHDNPYSLILADRGLSILAIPGAREIAVELNSVSKAYNMAGWRVGVLAGARKYLDPVFVVQSNVESGMPAPVQMSVAEALNQPDDWFDNLNRIYRKRKEFIMEMFDILGCRYDPGSLGLFLWGKVPDGYDGYRFSDKILHDARVFLAPGGIFGQNGSNFVRASLCADEPLLKEAVHRIKTKIKL